MIGDGLAGALELELLDGEGHRVRSCCTWRPYFRDPFRCDPYVNDPWLRVG